MTQTYEEKVEAAAIEHHDGVGKIDAIIGDNVPALIAYYKFKAGVEWARTNPSPEVMNMYKSFKELIEWYDIGASDSEQSKAACAALQAFNESREKIK